MPEFQLHAIDLIVVLIYVVFIVGLGFYFAARTKTTDDYFLAGRSLSWSIIGLSLFASNMSTSSLVGMAGEAYGTGIAVYNYEWMAAVVLVVFVWFFLPFYLQSRVFTMPEFLEQRFDQRSRYYFSALTIFLNIIVDTAAALYAGALVVQLIYPAVPMWQSVAVLAVLAGIYTIAGGLAAVVYTDAVQAVLLLFGSVMVTILAFDAVGSWSAVTAVTSPESLSLILPADDPKLPWPGLLTGVFVLGFYFWATNQFMVQRTLAAKDLNNGRWGALFAGSLKLPIIFIMVLPGTFARVLYSPEEFPALAENADLVFPTMMFDLLPPGIRALVITAMVAAIMSSVDSTLNSASTLVTMDFIKKLRPEASNRTLVIAGRVVTFVFMVAAATWAPVILRFETLWVYLQSVLAYLVPPVVALFVVGIFWNRANGHGAIWALVLGHVTAALLFVLGPVMGVVTIQFLYVPALLLLVSGTALVLISLQSAPPDAETVEQYTWSPALFRRETAAMADVPWYKNYRVQSIVLLLLTALFVGMFW